MISSAINTLMTLEGICTFLSHLFIIRYLILLNSRWLKHYLFQMIQILQIFLKWHDLATRIFCNLSPGISIFNSKIGANFCKSEVLTVGDSAWSLRRPLAFVSLHKLKLASANSLFLITSISGFGRRKVEVAGRIQDPVLGCEVLWKLGKRGNLPLWNHKVHKA